MIVVSDRWNGDSHLDPHQRQVCWSHLQRDFRRHADGLGEQKTFGETGLKLTRRVFAAWRAYQHERHDHDRLQAEIAPIQTALAYGPLRGLVQDSPVAACGLGFVQGGVGGEQRVVMSRRAWVEEHATDADGGMKPTRASVV